MRAGGVPVVARVLTAGCVAALAVAGLAGCGSSTHPGTTAVPSVRPPVIVGTQPAPGAVPGRSSAAPAGPAGAAGGGDTGPGTVTGGGTPAGPAGCAAGGVSLSQLPGDSGAAGSLVVALQVSNGSSKACALSGYPDFTLTAKSRAGADIAEPATLRHGPLGDLAFGDPPTTVVLTPGAHAGFLVQYSQVPYGDGGCVPVTAMRLPLPGSPTPVVGAVRMQVCGEPMLVSPYVPAARLSLG
jgi:hypothetical protein